MSTLFRPLSLKSVHKVLCFILALFFPHKKVFCIFFSPSMTLFGINVSKPKYTIFEIASDSKIIFLSSYSCLT